MDSYEMVSKGLPNRILLITSSGLSIIGSLVIMATYFLYKDIRTVSRHLVICISIADLFVTLSNCLSALLISPENPSEVSSVNISLCHIQSFISTTAVLCSFLWTMMLAVYLYCVVVRDSKRLGKCIVWPWAHLVCWLVPLTINVVALLLHKLGSSGDRNTSGWCWVNIFSDDLSDAKLWMFIDGKAFEIVTYVVILTIYIRIKILLLTKLHTETNSSVTMPLLRRNNIEAAKELDRKLILIPLIFILLRVWGTIRFFIFLSSTNDIQSKEPISSTKTALIYLQTAGDNLQGAANCILFCLGSSALRKRIAQSIVNLRGQKFQLHDQNDEEIVSPFSN